MNTRSLRLFVLPAVLTFALASCADSPTPAATVDGQPITNEELATTAAVWNAVFAAQQQPCATVDGAGDTTEAACNRAVLGAMVSFRLSNDYAAQHGITVSDADVEKAVQNFNSRFDASGQKELYAQLEKNGATRDDLRTVIRDSMIQQEVAKDLALQAQGEDALKAKYRQNIGDYTIIRVDHILVKTEAEAKQVYAEVTKPGSTTADFLALAKKVSIDPSVQQNGGALGSAYASTYDPDFAAAALKLNPGEISQPVQTQYGWHVIKMEEKQVTPYKQARNQILSDASTAAFADWMRQRAAEGAIEVNPSFGRFDAERLQIVRIASTDPTASATPSGATGPVNGVPSATASP